MEQLIIDVSYNKDTGIYLLADRHGNELVAHDYLAAKMIIDRTVEKFLYFTQTKN